MIKGFHHSGIVVKNLENSIAFYQDVMGLTLSARRERDGGLINQIVGYPDVHIKAALFDIGNSHFLELIEYIKPEPKEMPTEERAMLGAHHVAFMVTDIKQTLESIVKSGGIPLNEPVEFIPGRSGCYLQDPDGNWIELIEDHLNDR